MHRPDIAVPPQLSIISAASVPDQVKLPNAEAEVTLVREKAMFCGLPVSKLDGLDVSFENVMTAIKQSAWIHFACHGEQDATEPMESGLILIDGKLALRTIASLHLPRADFAFLSACHTASGADLFPDEALHLAAGFQVSGFRSVIGTMWAMGDETGPIAAEAIYD
jgi:CHAT domain-containing protein